MAEQGYNGWSNRATWNVNLWLSNDEGAYHEVNRLTRHLDPEDEDDVETAAKRIEQFARDIWPEGKTPDGDALSEADFEEIGKAWLEE